MEIFNTDSLGDTQAAQPKWNRYIREKVLNNLKASRRKKCRSYTPALVLGLFDFLAGVFGILYTWIEF